MSLETRDINDEDILKDTRQLNDGNGNIQFKITLPSGRTVNSEWIGPDNQKGAILLWVEAIRNQMVADAEEVRAEVRRQVQEREARERRAQAEMASNLNHAGNVLSAAQQSGQAQADGFPPLGKVGAGAFSAPVVPSSPTVASSASPEEYIRHNLELANKAVQHWQMQAGIARINLDEAMAAAAKWNNLLTAISGGLVTPPPSQTTGVISLESKINPSSGSDGVVVPRKRGRPVGSSKKPQQLDAFPGGVPNNLKT
jgi:hypothetical protein